MAACIMRAIWSDAPPAPAATTISTGLVGSQAQAEPHAVASASTPIVRVHLFIVFLQVFELWSGRARQCLGRRLREVVESRLHTALAMRHAGSSESHFNTGQRTAQHQVIEPAEM